MIKNLVRYGDMLDDAFLNGLIIEEEYQLLNNISINYGIYERNLYDAVSVGIVSDKQAKKLRGIRKHIYENALRTSLKKGTITEEEKKILTVLKESVGLSDGTLELIEKRIKMETHLT